MGCDWNGVCILNTEAKADLEWWVDNLERTNSRSLSVRPIDLEIYSDASRSGWCAYCNGVRTRGPWVTADGSKHINELELRACLFGLKTFTENKSNLSVVLFLDNTVAVHYINKRGGTRSKDLCAAAIKIITWCETRNLAIEAIYLPGILNVEADQQYRACPDASDWKLSLAMFHNLKQSWRMKVDLFASYWNTQPERFMSWRPQPEAWGINAFNINWNDLRGYAFPPFTLIPRCLAKIKREGAEVIFIAPIWPNQAWFPTMLEMVDDTILVMNPDPYLMISSQDVPHRLLESGGLLLAAWSLSGSDTKSRAFRMMWSNYSWEQFVNPHALLTSRPGTIGVAGACRGTRIPCQMIW